MSTMSLLWSKEPTRPGSGPIDPKPHVSTSALSTVAVAATHRRVPGRVGQLRHVRLDIKHGDTQDIDIIM